MRTKKSKEEKMEEYYKDLVENFKLLISYFKKEGLSEEFAEKYILTTIIANNLRNSECCSYKKGDEFYD